MLSVRSRFKTINKGELETSIYLDGEPICRAVTDNLSNAQDAEEFEKYLNSLI